MPGRGGCQRVAQGGGRGYGGWAWSGGMMQEGSSFSEEKEAKRLLFICCEFDVLSSAQSRESFLVLFFKKEHSS
jgi:hypothetical protein